MFTLSAILFFLVYKNAYDDWTEKREVLENPARRSASEVNFFSTSNQVKNALKIIRAARKADIVLIFDTRWLWQLHSMNLYHKTLFTIASGNVT